MHPPPMTLPWYRERWPWILMAGPAIVVVAGIVTMWIAFATNDGLVAQDYYKQGLAINRVIALEEAARKRGIAASISIASDRLTVRLEGEAPPALFAQLAHATRAGLDLRLRLAPSAAGVYEAPLPPLAPGHWRIALEDPRREWRIVQDAP